MGQGYRGDIFYISVQQILNLSQSGEELCGAFQAVGRGAWTSHALFAVAVVAGDATVAPYRAFERRFSEAVVARHA